ncbi:uncharacterized protein AMSG_04119 [Thecamonas trahens ATCC 50062]|uniref:Hydroxyproline O-arabinosyltransferase-like domain-containing protein n=1 Tax=Thecamonas trahens ATCC 50062 TaxID=461836 RepID=A0A0L0D9A8_THETB|nr:hypothetical protein AMSG_04119 [Thecamonas trahens ATCC 50062]KNC47888.1 hypothetical protein AMSG_04119 [Thecamonas trahens ATCC 50062]|eukprot:XP_013758910.1 hypothetical protein AMSG_04119 [Thecamonas trahens ATCC 50062]
MPKGGTTARPLGAPGGGPAGAAGMPGNAGTATGGKTLILLVISDNVYQDWQSRVFHYHMKKLLTPDQKLVTLISSPQPVDVAGKCAKKHNNCPLFPTGDYTKAANGDAFVVYNRAHAIREYMDDFVARRARGIDAEYTNVVIVEPDMIPLKPFDVVAPRGTVYGHSYFYMERGYGGINNSQLIEYCSFRPDDVAPIGVPYVLHVDDLIALLPLWIEKTVKMRLPQPWLASHERSWIADMWAFACAAADLHLTSVASPTFGPETAIDAEPGDDSMVIHYTYGYRFPLPDGSKFEFEKRSWTVEAPTPRPYPEPPADQANKLEKIHMAALNEALVAIFGPSE